MIKMVIKIKSFKKKFADQNKDLIKKKSWLSLSGTTHPQNRGEDHETERRWV